MFYTYQILQPEIFQLNIDNTILLIILFINRIFIINNIITDVTFVKLNIFLFSYSVKYRSTYKNDNLF